MILSKFIKNMVNLAVVKIKENLNKEIENQEKKTKVDVAINKWVSENTQNLSTIQKIIVVKYLTPLIPNITQAVYDCLKQKIEGITT